MASRRRGKKAGNTHGRNSLDTVLVPEKSGHTEPERDSVNRVAAAFEDTPPNIRTEFFDGLSAYFSLDDRRLAALARTLLVYAVRRWNLGSPIEPGRRLTSASFTHVLAEVAALAELLKKMEGVPTLVAHDSMFTFRNFLLGTSETTNRGTQSYALLGVFVMNIELCHPELKTGTRVTTEDRQLISDLMKQWQWLASAPKPGTSPMSEMGILDAPATSDDSKSMDEDVEIMRLYVRRFFDFPDDRRKHVQSFFRSAASADTGHAHFICYRPQLSKPASAVKSFFAIIPPGRGPNHNQMIRNYTFSHFYRADTRSDQKRRSVGVVMPMASALYLLGGQQTQHSEEGPDSNDFRTLKLVAIPWLPIEQNWQVIPGLVMSANNIDRLIVSRIAIIRTLLTQDSAIGIGNIDLSQIEKDMEIIAEHEAKVAPIHSNYLRNKNLKYQTEQILKVINNTPPLDVSGFFRGRSRAKVNLATVEDCLSAAFEGKGFVNDLGQPLTWRQLRFGPIEPSL